MLLQLLLQASKLAKKKTAEYYSVLASRFIDKIKVNYNKTVFAVCCDNENKMKHFQEIIVKKYAYNLKK